MTQINKTQLNKLRSYIDKNKAYLDSTVFATESEEMKFSKALSMCVLMEYFGLNHISAFEALTEGSGDNKIDAFYYSDDEDELSELIIVQSKYKKVDSATDTFSEDEIKLCINNCKLILKGENFREENIKLTAKLQKYRELLDDNGLPPINIKLFFATNGIIHEGHKKLNEVIECANENIDIIFIDATFFGNKIHKEKGEIKVNLKSIEDKTDSIFSIGDELYSGVVASCTLAELMCFYKNSGERFLLNNNVRFLLKNSNINKEIKKSFIEDPRRFCYLNNGISILCSEYQLRPTAHPITTVVLVKPSVINGGQTLASLYQLYSGKYETYKAQFHTASILIRIYKVPEDYSLKIAKATNSQNPINIVDLHSNDSFQKIAKDYLSQFGVGLITKIGEEITYYDDTITNENLLQVYASLYENDPAKAKVSKALIFKKYYDLVFNEAIDESVCKKLHRCYQISKFIQSQKSEDLVVIKNAFYSIIYTMKKINVNILNENILESSIQGDFTESFKSAVKLISKIISTKQIELKTKFSMNNLFKGNEIKDLIDLEFDK